MKITTRNNFTFTLVERPQLPFWEERKGQADVLRVRVMLDYILANYVTIEGKATTDEIIDLYYSLITTGALKHLVCVWSKPRYYRDTQHIIRTEVKQWSIRNLLTFDGHSIADNAHLDRGLFEYVKTNAPLRSDADNFDILDTVKSYVGVDA